MMRPRGYILLYGIAVLGVVIAAVMLLAHAAGSRADTQRVLAYRETAITNTDSALEQARTALNEGKLSAGATQPFGGIDVTCTKIPSGVKLEALTPCGPAPRAKTVAASQPRRGIRVVWELAPMAGRDARTTDQWRLSDWHSQNETIAR